MVNSILIHKKFRPLRTFHLPGIGSGSTMKLHDGRSSDRMPCGSESLRAERFERRQECSSEHVAWASRPSTWRLFSMVPAVFRRSNVAQAKGPARFRVGPLPLASRLLLRVHALVRVSGYWSIDRLSTTYRVGLLDHSEILWVPGLLVLIRRERKIV